LRHIFTLPPEI